MLKKAKKKKKKKNSDFDIISRNTDAVNYLEHFHFRQKKIKMSFY